MLWSATDWVLRSEFLRGDSQSSFELYFRNLAWLVGRLLTDEKPGCELHLGMPMVTSLPFFEGLKTQRCVLRA